MKNIFTPKEIAQFLNVAPTTIYAELKRGKLSHVRIGRKYIITRQHLEDYLSQNVVRELLDSEGQAGTSDASEKVSYEITNYEVQIEGEGKEGADWLDTVADDMARGIAVAERDVSPEELRAWLKVMEAAVKPLEPNNA